MPLSWPMSPPATTPPGVIEAGSSQAPDSPIDVGVPFYHTQQDFLDLIDRIYPAWYIDPLKASSTGGYELLQAYGKLFEKVSRAIGEVQVLSTLAYSSGGQNATASIQFYRPQGTTTGAFTVKAGTIIGTSSTNRRYSVQADIAFGANDWVKAAVAVSLGQDSDYNVPGPVVTADGTVLAGDIDTVILPILSPPFAEPALQVRQIADATGGCAPALDQIGDDRDIDRAGGEPDAVYKRRVRALPDTVSPNAIRRHLDALFYPQGLHYDLIETWENRYMSCWNAPDSGSDPTMGQLAQWVYNDPRTDRFIPRWMSERDHRSAYALILPTFPALADRGMVYNDPLLTAPSGRAISAWDAPPLDAGAVLSGVWNGADNAGQDARATFLSSTWNILRSIKGGGVNVSFIPAETNESLSGAPFP